MNFDETVRCLTATDQKAIGEMTALFGAIDRQTEEFSGQSGLKCKNGCGACCENPDIETTVAEVLPLAVHLWSKGLALSRLKAIRSNASKRVCVFYEPDPLVPGQGRCSIYAYRPGLCRLFGFAARKNKYGQQALVTCKIIKNSQAQTCRCAQEEMQKGAWTAPVLTTHALCVADIDPVHGQKLLPINQAISLGIEKIGYNIENIKQ